MVLLGLLIDLLGVDEGEGMYGNKELEKMTEIILYETTEK